MRIFGLEITRTKQAAPRALAPPDSRGGWFPVIREPFAGAWQRNLEGRQDSVLTNSTVFACTTLIASDVSKLPIDLVEEDDNGIWTVVDGTSPFWRVLRRPNRFQNRIKFFEYWVLSKLTYGNTYVLKQREAARGMVQALSILDPQRVTPLVAPDGSVYYQIGRDTLAGVDDTTPVVPASEIIHDLMYPLFHPLIGLSPIFACGMAAMQGLSILNNSRLFFENGSTPSGILTAPFDISQEKADAIQRNWLEQFSGPANIGKVAVLGGGAAYVPMSRTAVDSQLIEQLKWTAEATCGCYHVPGYMVGIGPAPPYTDIQSINLQYYTQALQVLIECIELCLDEGLEMPTGLGTAFDTDQLLRMDTATAVKAEADAINAGFGTPNEARARFGRLPVDGGDTPYLQQQYWPLAKLAARDIPTPPTAPPPAPPPEPPPPDDSVKDVRSLTTDLLRKALAA